MRPLSTPLQVVALLDVLTALLNHRIRINLGVLTLFIGIGLFRRNPRSLWWALFVTWLELALTALAGLLFLVTPGTLTFFGRPQPAPSGLGFLLSARMFALFFWQLKVLTRKVLTRKDTRAVFEENRTDGTIY